MRGPRLGLIALLLLFVVWGAYQLAGDRPRDNAKTTMSEMMEMAESGTLESAQIELGEKSGLASIVLTTNDGRRFQTQGLIDRPTLDQLDDFGVTVQLSVKPSWLERTGPPLLFFSVLFSVLFLRRRPEVFEPVPQKGSGFSALVGAEAATARAQRLIAGLRARSAYLPGLLVTGAPGCGKSMLLDAIAKEAGVPMLCLRGAGGTGAVRLRDLFGAARKQAPVIVAIDGVEVFARTRGGGDGDAALSSLLDAMTSIAESKLAIAVVATTD